MTATNHYRWSCDDGNDDNDNGDDDEDDDSFENYEGEGNGDNKGVNMCQHAIADIRIR